MGKAKRVPANSGGIPRAAARRRYKVVHGDDVPAIRLEGATIVAMVNSLWSLSADLLSARALVWFASWGRDADLTPEAHMFFFDRYSRLADVYRQRGRLDKSRRFQTKAREHYPYSDGGPPYAAAMGMVRPREFVRPNAVSGSRLNVPDDAA